VSIDGLDVMVTHYSMQESGVTSSAVRELFNQAKMIHAFDK